MLITLVAWLAGLSFIHGAGERHMGLRSGLWRGVIQMEGGELPFNFEISIQDGKYLAVIHNAEERIVADEITLQGDSVFIHMPVFDSEFRLQYGWEKMTGRFINHSRKEKNVFPFTAQYGVAYRFQPDGMEPSANITGRWKADFSTGTPDSTTAIAVFKQQGSRLSGTFLTTTGDYRYLEGTVQGNRFFLSAFDGSHPFLFKVEAGADGNISGMFFSGNHWKEPWTASRNETIQLPDASSITTLKPGFTTINFRMPDLNGDTVSLNDHRFKGKPVVVQIMGSWCPNCMDEISFYAPLYREYRNRGLEMVAIAFERTGDYEKAKANLQRMVSRLGMDYPVVFGGTTGENANKQLYMLNGIKAYPTSVFINKEGTVHRIITGISGPATGYEYEKWQLETRQIIEELLSRE